LSQFSNRWITTKKAGTNSTIDGISAAPAHVPCSCQNHQSVALKTGVRIHENHHLWSKTRVGKAKLDGQFELIYETADLVEPDPFPKGYQ